MDSYATNSNNEDKMLLTQMSNLQSIFSPPSQKQQFRRKGRRKNNNNKKSSSKKSKEDKQKQDDKENVQALSNGKEEKERKKEEVNRQIKRSQERRSNSKKSKGTTNQEGVRVSSNNKKHIGSLIAYDTRIKLRSKQKQSEGQILEQIENQKKEYRLLKKQRIQFQKMKEEDRLEQIKWIDLVKQSMNSSPKRKEKQSNTRVNTNPDIDGNIVVEKKGQELNQIKKNILISQKASRNESSSQESLNHYIMRVSNVESQAVQSSQSPTRQQQKFKNYLFEIKQYDQKTSPSRQYNTLTGESKEMSKQEIEHYLKQKKQREKNLQELKQADEEKKLEKIQMQLKMLQTDYQKGLKEFKVKQRVQSEKRTKSDKSKVSKKKRNTSKKKKTQAEKQLMNQQLPVYSPQRSNPINSISRASFQSPLQSLPNAVLRGGVKTEDFYSNNSSSPLRQVSSQSKNDAFSQKLIPRGSLASSSTMENFINYQQYPSMRSHLASSQDMMQFNKKSSVPVLLPSSKIYDSMIPQGKKCTIFNNESLKDLDQLRNDNNQLNNYGRLGHKKSMADLKRDKLFEEFTKMRKELERNLKENKIKKDQEKKEHSGKKGKRVAKKLKKTSINLPFKAPQQINGLGNNCINIQNDQLQNVEVKEEAKRAENIEETKQRIFFKLQEVAEKMQSIFKSKQQQQQQTLMLSGTTNIILEEESKENELTHQSPATSKPQSNIKVPPQIIGGEVSQIKLNDEDSEGGIANKNENTTFLLKKMYSEEEKFQLPEQINSEKVNAAQVIQKNFRGYICRRVLKEKLRIDKEFKLIRQKYEVKSNSSQSNMSQGLLSSMALSKSNYNPLKMSSIQPNKLKPDLKIKRATEEKKGFPDTITENIEQNSQQEKSQESSLDQQKYNSNQSPVAIQTENIFKRQSVNQFFGKSGQTDTSIRQNVSVFQSPSIIGNNNNNTTSEQQVNKSSKVFEYQPKKLFDENQLQQDTLLSQPLLNSIVPMISSQFSSQNKLQEQDRSKEEIKEEESLNESMRSKNPVADSSPIFQKSNPYNNVVMEELEQSPIANLNQHIIDKQKAEEYLDSPLQLQDLDQKRRLSNTLPPTQKNKNLTNKQLAEEDKQEQIKPQKELPLKMSPIIQQTPQSLIHLQKPSFDVSSLINYDEEKQLINQQRKKEINQDNNEKRISEDFGQKQIIMNEEPINLQFNQGSPISSSQNNNSSFLNFGKNSFQQFAQEKIKKAFKAESQIENWIQDLTSALQENIKLKQKQLKEQDLSVRTYNRKKMELERWVEKEKREIKLTQRYFMQGKLKLSQLLDNFVKDKDRMKVAVSQIKNDGSCMNLNLRKSHSFDAEILKQHIDVQNISSEYNTISGGRRLSSGLPSLDGGSKQKIYEEEDFQSQSIKAIQEKDLEELKKEESKSIFEYQLDSNPFKGSSFDLINSERAIQSKAKSNVEILQEEEEKVQQNLDLNQIVLEVNKNQDIQQKSKRLSLGEEYLNSQMDFDLNSSRKNEEVSEFKVTSGGDDQNIHLSETPLGSGNEIRFPEEVKELESLEKEEEQKVSQIVEVILNQILLRELKDKLFPKRVITKSIKQLFENGVHQDKMEHVEEEAKGVQMDQNQILVIDSNDVNDQASPQASQKSPEVIQEKEDDPKNKGISTNILHVNDYMHDIFERIKNDKQVLGYVLENVSQPLYKDPLMILSHLQNSIPSDPSNPPTSTSLEQKPTVQDENIDMLLQDNPIPFQQSVLSVDLYLDIEKERRGGISISQMRDSYQEENTQSFIAEMENIHNKAIFDAVNEALDGFRPYGLRGPPLPWSKQNKTLTFKFGKEETVDYLLQKVKYKVLDWAHINAGILGQRIMTQREKDQLELLREERLARILIQEAEDNEALWTDYEYEETQAKLDLADIILHDLCFETATILDNIKDKQKEEVNQAAQD